MGLLQVGLPPFTTQKDMDASVAVPDACSANLFDSSFETGLLAATRFVMIGGTIELQDAACAPDRYAPFVTDRRRQLALASRQASDFSANDVLKHAFIVFRFSCQGKISRKTLALNGPVSGERISPFPNLVSGPAWLRPMPWRRGDGSARKSIEARGDGQSRRVMKPDIRQQL
jgi:hypothetical protein